MRNVLKTIAPRIKASALALFMTSVMCFPMIQNVQQVSAATNAPAAAGKVSFTFDDGAASAYTLAAPTLAKYGFTGTDYVTTGCIGMTTVPNTCKADTGVPYMSWAQVKALKSTYGWEIGSHTATHPLLASTDPAIQTTKLTTAQVVQELTKSKADLAAQGIDATALASPFGDYDMPVLAEAAKLYSSHRGFADTGYNVWPNSDYIVRVQQVQAGVSVATVKSYVDAAIANKQWLVLVFHEIKTTPSTNPDDYQYSQANLDQIAAYVKSKTVPVVNVSQGLVTSDVNLLPNASFNNGIADGWTTDAPTSITKDTAKNGSYPDPTNAIKFTGAANGIHLFSPQVAVNTNTTYMLKNYLNVQKLTSGEVGFYIDEYDAFGRWVSGQYKTAERSVFVESLNFTYKPTSSAVSKASLQVFSTANSGVTAYLDNVQWFPLETAATPPAATNLVANGTFDAGIAGGWTTDGGTSVVADSANNGSPANIAKSVKMTATTKNVHLFSPNVVVDSTKTYNLSTYLNIKQRTASEMGFYIDEMDANGNWISGQYKGGITAVGAAAAPFQYKPSSVNVKQARLQIICGANSGILAYVDDVRWIVQ